MASRREQAGLPLYSELRRATLEAMRSLAGLASKEEIDSAIAERLGLSHDQQAVMHVNGRQTELAYRAAWARTYLKWIGAVDNPSKGAWRLTDAGNEMAPETAERLIRLHRATQRQARQSGDGDASSHEDLDTDRFPDLEARDWTEELLERLMELSPTAFEHLAAALLRSAGFDDVEVTGRSGDGGIDGIGTYRPSGLISFHTAFQCKRYQGSVGASAIRDFRGSFIGRADRGIILTTGYFTPAAREEASRPGANPVDLIDGEAFCELLREHSLGVRTTQRVVEDITIDEAYFERLNP